MSYRKRWRALIGSLAVVAAAALGISLGALPARATEAICENSGTQCVSGYQYNSGTTFDQWWASGTAEQMTVTTKGTVSSTWPATWRWLDSYYAGHRVVWLSDGIGNCMRGEQTNVVSVVACDGTGYWIVSGTWLISVRASDIYQARHLLFDNCGDGSAGHWCWLWAEPIGTSGYVSWGPV